jgi:hypothetical protein
MSSRGTFNRIAGPGAAAAAVSLSVALLSACGGGGSVATSTAPSSYAMGRISGFGSVIVNGVHYDERNALVKDEDGEMHNQNDLKLGMVVEVQANEIGQANNVRSATAQNVAFSSLIRGPLESVAADKVVVLGQTVKVTATTVFDDSLAGGIAALKVGAVMRIYGTVDATTGIYTATRIEPQSGAELYRLRGVIAALDPSAKTLKIGSAVIDVSKVSVPEGLKAGSLVRVKLQTSAVNGAWVAASVKAGLIEPQNNDHSEVEGTITDFTSSSAFSVDGLSVDASKAAFPDGTAGLMKGARVEVEGAIVNAVVVATSVHLRSDEGDRQEGFDVDGVVTAVDTGKSTLVVRGVTASFAGNATYTGGTAADLKPGVHIKVHGTLAADGSTLTAARIEIKR